MGDPSKCWTSKNAPAITYPDLHHPSPGATLPSAPCTHSSGKQAAVFRREQQVEGKEDVDPDYHFGVAAGERNQYYPSQKDLTSLISALGHTKSNAELLPSRLSQWNLLDESI